MPRKRISPDAAVWLKALDSSLSVLLTPKSAHPNNAKTGTAAAMLHLNNRGTFDDARRPLQAGTMTADVKGVCVLLERVAEQIPAADFYAQSGGVARFWTSAYAHANMKALESRWKQITEELHGVV